VTEINVAQNHSRINSDVDVTLSNFDPCTASILLMNGRLHLWMYTPICLRYINTYFLSCLLLINVLQNKVKQKKTSTICNDPSAVHSKTIQHPASLESDKIVPSSTSAFQDNTRGIYSRTMLMPIASESNNTALSLMQADCKCVVVCNYKMVYLLCERLGIVHSLGV